MNEKGQNKKNTYIRQTHNITYLAEISGYLLLINTTYFNKELVIIINFVTSILSPFYYGFS